MGLAETDIGSSHNLADTDDGINHFLAETEIGIRQAARNTYRRGVER